MGRYSGSRMFDATGQQLLSSGFKRAISSGVNSALAHKVADVIVNGATLTSPKVVKCAMSVRQKAAESVINNAVDSTKKWIVGKK